MQTVISQKGVGVQVIKNNNEDKEPTFNNVHNTLVKSELWQNDHSHTFTPVANKK